MAKTPKENKSSTPDRRPVKGIQAQRLASLARVDVKKIAGGTVADLSEKFKWQIDPELFLFRRVCGRVIKRDPATGAEYPVPFATVHVEDTDCNLLGFFPGGSPFSWYLPLFCRREEIATVVTDACGRFCVFIPRWEIDWILRYRLERICYPDIFIRPSIRDLLEPLVELPKIRPPRPEPDPPPFLLQDGGLTFSRAEQLVGREAAEQLAAFEASAALGEDAAQRARLLQSRAFHDTIPPPLPAEFKLPSNPGKEDPSQRAMGSSKTLESACRTLAASLNVDVKKLDMNVRRFIGPFRRCRLVLVPEWVALVDVPDITFRVTQDVDGDGDEETIYSEGLFDVRWDSGPIPDVTLEASAIAQAGVTCDTPEVPCEEGVPAVNFVGLMPLINPPGPADPYHDSGSGYARRPNRPHPSGNLVDPPPNPLAETPYARVLQLYGCNTGPKAVYYRLRYQFNGGPAVPFTGLTWPLHRVVSGSLQTTWPTADANGWYPILPLADGWFPAHLLLNWPTGGFQNGLYTVDVQLGNSSKAVINTSAPVSLLTDNTRPTVQFTELRWRVAGGAWSPPISLICPVIPRPLISGNPADIELRVSYQVASVHLRSMRLYAGGCGAGNPTLISALSTAEHWHTNPGDNAVSNTATYALPGTRPPGAYSFSLFAVSRAFNPSGGDGGFGIADWNYDPVYNWVWPRLSVAVVNA